MGSRSLREFEIQIQRLDYSAHEFEFKINKDFFLLFENGQIEEGEGEAFLTLEKSETMMHLHFKIDVKVNSECDISLVQFEEKFHIEKNLIVKFGEVAQEMSEDVIVIDRTDPSFNVANFIFEYVTLQIPIKKIHPSLRGVDRPEVAYRDVEPNNKNTVDPRWEALKKLKN